MRVDLLTVLTFTLGASLTAELAPPPAAVDELSLPPLLIAANEGLRAQGMDYLIEGVEFLNAGKERTSIQLHRQDYGWVVGDPRRADAQLPGLSWALDRTWPADSNHGTTAVALGKSLQRAAAAWNQTSCLPTRALVAVQPPEDDLTVFDYFLGRGGLGSALRADVVAGGFRRDLQAVFGSNTLAFTITFVFVDAHGEPTDIDRDGRFDTATTEIYLNDALAWSFDGPPPLGSFDATTVLVHELGHALGLPHFGPPPVAVMNPTYRGSLPVPGPTDDAALCSLFAGSGIYTHGDATSDAVAADPKR